VCVTFCRSPKSRELSGRGALAALAVSSPWTSTATPKRVRTTALSSAAPGRAPRQRVCDAMLQAHLLAACFREHDGMRMCGDQPFLAAAEVDEYGAEDEEGDEEGEEGDDEEYDSEDSGTEESGQSL
jgi:hypothetical protein